MAIHFNFKTICSISERMNGCKFAIESTSERTYDENFFGNKDTTTEKITVAMMTAKSPVK